MNATVSLHTGRIKVAAPFPNQYLVSEVDGGEAPEIMATALEEGSNRRGGHIGGGAYVPGAIVLIAKIILTEETSSRPAYPNLILGAFNPFSSFEGTDWQPGCIQQDSNSDVLRNQGYRRLLEAEPNTILNENRGANRPLDILPGDWFKSNVLGGLFLLSEFMASVGSSPDCQISFNGIDQLAELISMNFSADHASVFRELIHRGLTAVDISRYALTLTEGLGSNVPLKEVDNIEEPWRLEPVIEGQTGFFRDERFSGGAVEGAWRFCRTTLAPTDPHTFGSHTYPGVFSEMARMDGIYRLRAAKEICFEKTAAIVTPWMTQELRGAPPAEEEEEPPSSEEDPPPQTDTEFRKRAAGLASDDEVYALMPLLHDVFSTAEEAEVFFKGLRKDDHIWHFPTKDEAQAEIFKTASEEEEGTRILTEAEREYTLTDLVEEDLEIYPGRKVKLFRNSSVFLMTDDGGITIGDGFGGEIRMHRGRVTIASIGDIEFLPGRDLIEQVPGNRITRAGNRVEISSTQGSVAIKAQNNMQLVSGGDEGGVLTVENRSPERNLTEIDPDQLLQDQPFGAGIILKCTGGSGVSLLGSHIYGGGYSRGAGRHAASKTGVDSASTPCDIMLDAGSKDLMLNGQNGIMSFRKSISMSMMQSVTGIYITSDAIVDVATGGISMATPEVRMESMRNVGQLQIIQSVLKTTNVDTSHLGRLPNAHPTLYVRDGLVVGAGGIRTEGSIGAEGGISANKGVTVDPLAHPRDHDFNMHDDEQNRANDIKRTLSDISLSTQTLMQSMVNRGMATQYGQGVTDFAFPDSKVYRAAEGFKFVAPKWQTLLSADAQTWKEKEVTHAILEDPTYPYPGRGVHDAKSSPEALEVRKGDKTEKRPIEEYKVNLPST